VSVKRSRAVFSLAGAVVTAGLLFAAPAGAAAVGPADSYGTNCFTVDNYIDMGGCLASTNQGPAIVAENGVAILSSSDGTATAGIGAAGDAFDATEFDGGITHTCTNGWKTATYYYGTDENTGVSGWVADCDLDGSGT
jgi:hypothetical protein